MTALSENRKKHLAQIVTDLVTSANPNRLSKFFRNSSVPNIHKQDLTAEDVANFVAGIPQEELEAFLEWERSNVIEPDDIQGLEKLTQEIQTGRYTLAPVVEDQVKVDEKQENVRIPKIVYAVGLLTVALVACVPVQSTPTPDTDSLLTPTLTPTVDLLGTQSALEGTQLALAATQTAVAQPTLTLFSTPTAEVSPTLMTPTAVVPTTLAEGMFHQMETQAAQYSQTDTARASIEGQLAALVQQPTPTPTREEDVSLLDQIASVDAQNDEGHTLNRTDNPMVRFSNDQFLLAWQEAERLEAQYGDEYLRYNETYAVLSGQVPEEITGDPEVTVLFGIQNPARNPLRLETVRMDFGFTDMQYAVTHAQPLFDVTTAAYTDEANESRLGLTSAVDTVDFRTVWGQNDEEILRSRLVVPSLRDVSTGLFSQMLGIAQILNDQHDTRLTATEVSQVAQNLTNQVLLRDWELSATAIRPLRIVNDTLVSETGIVFPAEVRTCRVQEGVDTVGTTFGDRIDQPEVAPLVSVFDTQSTTEAAPYHRIGEQGRFAIHAVADYPTLVASEWVGVAGLTQALSDSLQVLVVGDEEQGVTGAPSAFEFSPQISREAFTEFTMIRCGRGEDAPVIETEETVPPTDVPHDESTPTIIPTATPTSEISPTPRPSATYLPTNQPTTVPTLPPRPTDRPTSTPVHTPTETPRPTNPPRTPYPTPTEQPSVTPTQVIPTETPRPTETLVIPTRTPLPTNQPTTVPTLTPRPTDLPTSTLIPTPTETPKPTNQPATPYPTVTEAPATSTPLGE